MKPNIWVNKPCQQPNNPITNYVLYENDRQNIDFRVKDHLLLYLLLNIIQSISSELFSRCKNLINIFVVVFLVKFSYNIFESNELASIQLIINFWLLHTILLLPLCQCLLRHERNTTRLDIHTKTKIIIVKALQMLPTFARWIELNHALNHL